MKKKYTLTEAIKMIETKLPHLILTSIEFEDGSMRKFIVGLRGWSNKSFMSMDVLESI